MRLTALALPVLLALAACGGSEDPCTVAAETKVTPSSLQDLGVSDNALSCTGTSGSTSLACAGSASLERATCSDGFAFTIESGNARVLLHLKGGDGWRAGAKVAGGEDLDLQLTFAGLQSPDTLQPPSGKQQAAKFSMHSSAATFDGSLTTTW